MHKEGLARFATSKYDTSLDNRGNRFAHLTNYSVNKFNQAFQTNLDAEKDDEGSKWSLTALKKHL
jgi:hypothetical protein